MPMKDIEVRTLAELATLQMFLQIGAINVLLMTVQRQSNTVNQEQHRSSKFVVSSTMAQKSTNDSIWSISSIDETYMEHRLTRAFVGSDASLDEEEEIAIEKEVDLKIDMETDEEMKAALEILPKHGKFSKYLRDILHFVLCSNNFVNKPLREVWISKGSPFTEHMGYAVLVEQIISRMSLKAIFLSRKIRHTKDACDLIVFVFSRRKAEYDDNCYLLMLELLVIAFELLLYCVIEEMLVLPMKDIVKVCTKIYRKMIKPNFEKKRCWQYLDMYATREYQDYFSFTRICYKTLGYPYDIFAIPKPYKVIWKRKVTCITKTFYDYVPLKYFHYVSKEYKEEFDKLDLTPDSNFVRRIIMRKAARRKIYREERLEAETLGTKVRVEEPITTDEDIGTFGGAKPKSYGGAKPKVFYRSVSEDKIQEKKTRRQKRHRRSRTETDVGGTAHIEKYETSRRVSSGAECEAVYSVGDFGVEEQGAVGDVKYFGDEKNQDFRDVGSIGDEELGAVGGVGISYSTPEITGDVLEKPKHSILKKSRSRSTSRVRWDEKTVTDKPETDKKKLKPKKKKVVPIYIPEEVMSDLECFGIYEDSKDDRPVIRTLDDKTSDQPTHALNLQQEIVDADPPPSTVETDSLKAALPESPAIAKSEDECEDK